MSSFTVGGFEIRSGTAQAEDAASQLRESAAFVEAEFITELFKAMRETVPKDSPGADGAADMFWEMMAREVADRAALRGGYGLGEAIYGSMAHYLGEDHQAPAPSNGVEETT